MKRENKKKVSMLNQKILEDKSFDDKLATKIKKNHQIKKVILNSLAMRLNR